MEKKKKLSPEKLREVRMKNLKSWKKGQSGNPAGRKKSIPKLKDELIELLGGTAHDGSDSGMRRVLENIFNEATKRGNPNAVRAAAMLIERAYGSEPIKLDSSVDVTTNGESINKINIKALDDDTIEKIINAMGK